MMKPSSLEGVASSTATGTATASSVIIPRYKQRVRPVTGNTKPTQYRAAIKKSAAPFLSSSSPSSSPSPPPQPPPRSSPSSSPTKTRDWSRDPLGCPHSDWTIHVLCRRQQQQQQQHQQQLKFFSSKKNNHYGVNDTYYISTHALKKLAPHRAPLFERILFECLEETGDAESRLIIDDVTVAQGFGVLLDLLYAKTEEEEIEVLSNIKNARALYRIAEYFDARPLQEKVATLYETTTREFSTHPHHGRSHRPTPLSSITTTTTTSIATGKENCVLEPSSRNSSRSRWFPSKARNQDSANIGQGSSVMAVCRDKSTSQRHSHVPDPAVSPVTSSNRRIRRDPETSLPFAAVSLPSSTSSTPSSIVLSWPSKSKREKSKADKRQDKTATPPPPPKIKKGSLLEKRTQESPTTEHEALEPMALLQVLKQKRALSADFTKLDSENFSCLIALCIQQNRGTIDRATFYKLTSKENMPHVDPEAALQLLILEVELEFWNEPNTFSSLQSRCIRSILANWDVSRKKYPSDEHYWKALRKLSPSVLAILLMHTSGTHHGDDSLSQDHYS